MTSVTLQLGIGLACLWLLRALYTSYRSPLSAIPNAHFSVPYSPLWNLINKWKARENRARFQAHQRLGPVVRIGPGEISIHSMDMVQQVYGGNFDKDGWYPRAFTGDEPPVAFTMLPKEPHAERKRMLARHYSKLSIQSSPELQEMNRSVICVGFREELHKWAREDSTIDILDTGKAMMMDLTTAWLMGPTHRTHLLQDPVAAEEILGHFRISFDGFFWRSEFWDFLKFLKQIGIYFIPRAAYSSRLSLRRWCAETCEASEHTFSRDAAADDAVDANGSPPVYIKLRQALKESGFPSPKIVDVASAEVLDHLLASHDVVGITLTYLLYELSKHPSIQQALREEVRAHFVTDSDSYSRCFDRMPLLDAVLMETLRFRSANPGPWPRRTPAPACRIGAYGDVPAGTIVSASSYTLHRNSAVFPEPEEWIPARWMDASKESHKEMMRWFWAFGSGARMCIGSHFAINSLKVIAATIYSEFETEVVDDSGMEQIDGIVAGPVGDKLLLKFRHVNNEVS